jgi:hypothetical protein
MFQAGHSSTFKNLFFLFTISLLISACSSSEKFTGFDYDPPDVTNTIDKELEEQARRVIGAGNPRVWVSNEFDGARLSDFTLQGDSLYRVLVRPELSPINNSPWYAFKIWSDDSTRLRLRIDYESGQHRYYPKFSYDGLDWDPFPEDLIREDSACGCIELDLELNRDTLHLSAQEMYTYPELQEWLKAQSSLTFLKVDTIGYSHQGRPLVQMIMDETEADEHSTLVVVSRQHPPEITGYLASRYFLEEMAGDSELAASFRKKFRILVYPMTNPDGADGGHWRYNAGGVDLNRDWENFNQPESRAINQAITSYAESGGDIIYGIDFHSTDENLFYPILPEIEKPKGDITNPWIEKVMEANPDVRMRVEPFDTSSPIFKNWLFKTFDADALTYEVDDDIDRDKLLKVSRFAAQSLMKTLLEKSEQ